MDNISGTNNTTGPKFWSKVACGKSFKSIQLRMTLTFDDLGNVEFGHLLIIQKQTIVMYDSLPFWSN